MIEWYFPWKKKRQVIIDKLISFNVIQVEYSYI